MPFRHYELKKKEKRKEDDPLIVTDWTKRTAIKHLCFDLFK